MTHSYSAPGVSEKDTVRFLLQDTNTNEWLLSDEEIQYYVDELGEVWGMEFVASTLASVLASRYAREASYSADGVSINLAQQAQQFRELAVDLRARRKELLVGGFPDVGGISPYEELDPSIKNYAFGTGMHDDAEAGEQDFGNRDYPHYLISEYPGI